MSFCLLKIDCSIQVKNWASAIMKKTFEQLLLNLPPYLGKEIFRFIIPGYNPGSKNGKIVFYDYQKYSNNNSFSYKYKTAFINDNDVLINETGQYLSRIEKKNGQHRYYITDELETMYCCECNHILENTRCRICDNRRPDIDYYYSYNSVYVGKDLHKALLELSFWHPNVST